VYSSVAFTPLPPNIISTKLSLFSSCAEKASGKIILNGIIGSTNNYRYYLRKGLNNFENCAETLMTDCLGLIKKGLFSDSTLIISDLPKGEYTLIITNDGFDAGNNYSWINCKIEDYAPIKITSEKVSDAKCSSNNKGSIILTANTNDLSSLKISIDPKIGDVILQKDSIIFSNLITGVYFIHIKDDCARIDTTAQFEILFDKNNIKAQVTVVKNPEADSIQNGILNIYIADGPAIFGYKILRSNHLYISKDTCSNKNFMIDRFPTGKYLISITDPINTGCKGWDTSIIIQKSDGLHDPISSSSISFNKTGVTSSSLPSTNNYFIVINKPDYVMKVYKSKECIATYPVAFGNKDQGDKMCEGDRKTPDGLFTIIAKRVHDKWDKYFTLDYPTAENHKKFNLLKSNHLIPDNAAIGGSIGIHGTWPNEDFAIDQRQNWTDGCISLKNKNIEELYNFIPVGTKVLIIGK
jgi:hypothetical protein